VRLVAIAKEPLGREEFVKDWWAPPAELFLDTGAPGFPVFKEANGGSQGLSGVASYLVGGAVAKNSKRVDAKGIKGDMKGEGKILGAVLVVDKSGELLFHHQEKSWGDHPTDEDLAAAIDKM
jgi:hypothetical protein